MADWRDWGKQHITEELLQKTRRNLDELERLGRGINYQSSLSLTPLLDVRKIKDVAAFLNHREKKLRVANGYAASDFDASKIVEVTLSTFRAIIAHSIRYIERETDFEYGPAILEDRERRTVLLNELENLLASISNNCRYYSYENPHDAGFGMAYWEFLLVVFEEKEGAFVLDGWASD